jgi:hypothetical protein
LGEEEVVEMSVEIMNDPEKRYVFSTIDPVPMQWVMDKALKLLRAGWDVNIYPFWDRGGGPWEDKK